MADGATRLFSEVGAHILAIFLFCAALLLLTGATVAENLAGVTVAIR